MEIGKHEVLAKLQHFDLMGMGSSAEAAVCHEYGPEAERIARLVSDGRPLAEAITVTFDDHFWAGCLQEAERRDSLAQLLRDLEQTPDTLRQ